MASPQRPAQKNASRWNWMQQAVASVESRLDTILGEEDEPQRKPSPAPAQPAKQNAPPQRESIEISRSGASTPNNDRLQERLARAMAKKGGSRPESPMPEKTDEASEHGIDHMANPTEEGVADQGGAVNDQAVDTTEPATILVTEPGNDMNEKREIVPLTEDGVSTAGPHVSQPNERWMSEAASARTSAEGLTRSQVSSGHPSTDSCRNDASALVAQMENHTTQLQMQDEINGYIERLDALQAKLRYLTTEAAEAAKQAATASQNGSAEKKLLEKDHKIALLMQEGQKLSATEVKYLQTIKKIRHQIVSANKDHDATKARAEKAERSLRIMEDRAKRAEAASKRVEQNLASNLSATNDFEALAKERNALNATLAEIKAQLSRANARADAAENKAETEQLEKEQKRSADLQDDLTSIKVERELAEEKLRREIKDLKALLEREKEHSRTMETEMLGEQATLESKLESIRARAEEAYSSDQGHVQAKLLRQIETLQSQYSAASQNWQGIEGSLLARITALEKERDDIAARETDARRKLREATLKMKKVEREAEEVQSRLPELEKREIEAEEEKNRATRKIKQLESEVTKLQTDIEEQRVQAEKEIQLRIDEERAKWSAALQTQRTDSPATSLRKGSGLGFDLMSPLDRPSSRRASYLPTHETFTPPRQQSLASLKGLSNGAIPETPSIITSTDADEYFANVPPTPVSHSHAASARAVHDLVSASTVGTGPSVQLVERMSANVRRLESEKAASKDEISRVTTQRDESRQEVVALMREAEEKRTIEERLKALETDHQSLTERHQTTLELLGEKSEQVEELKADIIDVKQMYRQLADTMGKS